MNRKEIRRRFNTGHCANCDNMQHLDCLIRYEKLKVGDRIIVTYFTKAYQAVITDLTAPYEAYGFTVWRTSEDRKIVLPECPRYIEPYDNQRRA